MRLIAQALGFLQVLLGRTRVVQGRLPDLHHPFRGGHKRLQVVGHCTAPAGGLGTKVVSLAFEVLKPGEQAVSFAAVQGIGEGLPFLRKSEGLIRKTLRAGFALAISQWRHRLAIGWVAINQLSYIVARLYVFQSGILRADLAFLLVIVESFVLFFKRFLTCVNGFRAEGVSRVHCFLELGGVRVLLIQLLALKLLLLGRLIREG